MMVNVYGDLERSDDIYLDRLRDELEDSDIKNYLKKGVEPSDRKESEKIVSKIIEELKNPNQIISYFECLEWNKYGMMTNSGKDEFWRYIPKGNLDSAENKIMYYKYENGSIKLNLNTGEIFTEGDLEEIVLESLQKITIKN